MPYQKSNTQWWTEEKDNVHKSVFETVRTIYNDTRERLDRQARCLRLYGNNDVLGMGISAFSVASMPTLPENRIKLNVISSMCDTVCSKISKMKPKVTFLTDGGDYSAQKQAKQLTKFILGAFYNNKIHEMHQTGFRDSTIFDIGAIKHFVSGNEIVSERVLPFELLVDPFEAVYGKPLQLHQMKHVHRSKLKALFPKYENAIMNDRETIDPVVHSDRDVNDFVLVVESWRLPSSKKAKDGRHTITIGCETLLDEKYTKDYFPFTFFRWSRPVVGFYGQSLAERLIPNQLEINKMLRIIQRSFHLGSAFKVFLEYGSKVSKEHINNDLGSIIYYMGQKPEYYVPQTVHQEYFQHLKFLIQSAYEEAGVSQLSASSRKPAGLDSGRAIREVNDLESERFAIVSQDYEATFLETARIYVDLAEEIAKSGGDFEVKAQSKQFIESIKWSDIDLEKDAYIMQMFPTSMLPHEPAGRLQFVQELITSGMIPPSFGAELLNFPDLEGYMNIKNAAIEDLFYTLEQLMDGEYPPPEPYQDLSNGIAMMQSAYLRAKREGAPAEVLENIDRWITTADSMVSKARATATPMVPQAAAMTAPVMPGQ